jgi:hypothetical protein
MHKTDVESDTFTRMIETFRDHMIAAHGFTFEEANAVVIGEVKRKFDHRKRSRATLRVIEGGLPRKIGLKATK